MIIIRAEPTHPATLLTFSTWPSVKICDFVEIFNFKDSCDDASIIIICFSNYDLVLFAFNPLIL